MNEIPPFVRREDPRDLKAGRVVSDRNGYYDSQNIVAVVDDGVEVLSVVLHHSENREGGPGLQLFATRSADRGRTWTALAPLETDERQSHDGYQLLHRDARGRERLYVFYGWNRGAQYPEGADPTLPVLRRTDMQLDEGYWCRVSHDGGRTWGADRHLVPVRRTEIDRGNPWGGRTMGMFLCDKPTVIGGAVHMAFQKTRDGAGETPGSEVFVLRSRDLLSLDDPARATWETLPSGERGLQAPGGALRLGEEPHVLHVGDDPMRLWCVWRTETGRLANALSADGGDTWDEPSWLTYEGLPMGAGGVQVVKNPRGAITPYRLRGRAPGGEAEYVLLFYNNGRTERDGYVGRRVCWLTAGRAAGGVIRWNQPEIALWWDGTGFEDRPDWNADWAIVDGPGYADLTELADGTLVLVASNKLAVRYHEVDARLLALLRAQPDRCCLPDPGPVLDVRPAAGERYRGPVLDDLRTGGGFTIAVVLRGGRDDVAAAPHLLSATADVTAAMGEEPTDRRITKGWALAVTPDGELELTVTDGIGSTLRHRTATAVAAGLWDGRAHLVGFVADGGPKVVSVVVDDRLDDGGDGPQGWTFVPVALGEVGGAEVHCVPGGGAAVVRLLVYDRPLLTSELVAAGRWVRAQETTR